MAQSRKDSRGYALRSGECQRADGRYSYSYTDRKSKRTGEAMSRQLLTMACLLALTVHAQEQDKHQKDGG